MDKHREQERTPHLPSQQPIVWLKPGQSGSLVHSNSNNVFTLPLTPSKSTDPFTHMCPPFLHIPIGSGQTQILSYWTMLPRSSQICPTGTHTLCTTRGCLKHRRLNLIELSRSLTTGWHRRTLEWFVLLAIIPTRLPSHADRKAIQLDCQESSRCEG